MTLSKVIKQHDRATPLIIQSSYEQSTDLLDIPTSTPVVFTMTKDGAISPKVNRQTAQVVSSSAGVVTVQYNWGATDTDTPGLYRGEFEVNLGGLPLTLPTQGYLSILIEEDLS